MTENIYSNPTGMTNTPWHVSVAWFKNAALQEISRIESASKQKPKIRNARCPNCDAIVSQGVFLCVSCGREVRDLSFPETVEKIVLLTDVECDLLDSPISKLKKIEQERLVEIHNLLVASLRIACNLELQSSSKKIKVRDGLTVTPEWDAHFRNLFIADPQLLIWLAAKHAMLGNPLAGEILEWSNSMTPSNSRNFGVKLGGAAAAGLLAGLLFG